MSYKASRMVYKVCLWTAVALISASLVLEKRWPAVISIVLLVGGAAQGMAFCKCPACGQSLSIDKKAEKCPQCGKKLD